METSLFQSLAMSILLMLLKRLVLTFHTHAELELAAHAPQ
jgi:hypothetical protein